MIYVSQGVYLELQSWHHLSVAIVKQHEPKPEEVQWEMTICKLLTKPDLPPLFINNLSLKNAPDVIKGSALVLLTKDSFLPFIQIWVTKTMFVNSDNFCPLSWVFSRTASVLPVILSKWGAKFQDAFLCSLVCRDGVIWTAVHESYSLLAENGDAQIDIAPKELLLIFCHCAISSF